MDYRYMPFYMPGSMLSGAYYQPVSDIEEKDMDYLKEMYPKTMRRIQDFVEEECDRQEFDGSIIYDQYPDKIGIGRIINRVYDKMSTDMEEDVESYRDKMWIKDVIGILLLNEMYRRRAKRRNRRRYYYMR